jgi:hypothetical protein
MDRQGQNYEPFIAEDELILTGPILTSEIDEIVRKKYGAFVDKWETDVPGGEFLNPIQRVEIVPTQEEIDEVRRQYHGSL